MRDKVAVYVQGRYAKPPCKVESYDTRAWPGLELVCHALREAGIELEYCSAATVGRGDSASQAPPSLDSLRSPGASASDPHGVRLGRPRRVLVPSGRVNAERPAGKPTDLSAHEADPAPPGLRRARRDSASQALPRR
jgi:hypothetical protein